MRWQKKGRERDGVCECVLNKQQRKPKRCDPKLANPN